MVIFRFLIQTLLVFFVFQTSFADPSAQQSDLTKVENLQKSLYKHYLKVHPPETWDYDWTTAVFLYGVIQSSNRGENFPIQEVDTALVTFSKNKIPDITMPDLASMSLPAVLIQKSSKDVQALEKIVQASLNFFKTEPLNQLGVIDHVGQRHRFAWFLPKTSLFVPSSVWADSSVMSALNGYIIFDTKNDSETKKFFTGQFLKIHDSLWDSSVNLYKHAFFIDSKKYAPEKAYWSRGNGWMLVAAIDLLERMKSTDSDYAAIKNHFIEHVKSLEADIDLQNGLKTLLRDPSANNYFESSGSAMLAYAMLKGYRLGYLEKKYFDLGYRYSQNLISKYIDQISPEEVSLKDVSGPTTAVPWDFYYKILVGLRRDESYGVGVFMLMLGELAFVEKQHQSFSGSSK